MPDKWADAEDGEQIRSNAKDIRADGIAGAREYRLPGSESGEISKRAASGTPS
jgi:hypothetical protein